METKIKRSCTVNVPSATPSKSFEEVIGIAENAFDGKYRNHPGSLEYFVKSDDSIVLTHTIKIDVPSTGKWYEAFVDANSGEIVSVTDYTADATYTVLPYWKQNPTLGIETVIDPEDADASPNGWSSDGTTAGNNVQSYVGSNSNLTTGYDYTYDPSEDPQTSPNIDAARVQAFYLANLVHDFSYQYGFTEEAYNFQADNFEKGGKGGDPVWMSVQDTLGLDNSAFTTFPE